MSEPIYARDYVQSLRLGEMGYRSNVFEVNQTGSDLASALRLNPSSSFALDTAYIDNFANSHTVVGVFSSPVASDPLGFPGQPGLNAVVFRSNSGELIITVSGVDGTSDFVSTTARTVKYGFNDFQYSQLRNFLSPILALHSNAVIDVVGHSLGGQLAHILYADLTRQGSSSRIRNVVTFASYGIDTGDLYNFFASNSHYVPDYRELLWTVQNDLAEWKITNFA